MFAINSIRFYSLRGLCLLLLLLLLLLLFNDVNGYSGGAPASAGVCRDLTPQHGVGEQRGESPFWLYAQLITGTNAVNVTLLAPRHTPFKGFILQARDDQGSIVNGEFSESDGVKAISCLNTRPNTLTHNSNRLKYAVSTFWRPYSSAVRIRFAATVVLDKLRFFKDLRSPVVEIIPQPVTTFTTVTTEISKPRKKLNFPETAYEGCGVTKTCFGTHNCLATNSCEILLTGHLVKENVVRFELYGNTRNAVGDKWFSMGVSHNGKMSGSSVTDCIALTTTGNVILQDSWNDGYSNRIYSPPAITPVFNSIQDGFVRCVWERQMVTQVNGQTFDLSKSFIILAYGNANGNQKYKHDHTDREASGSVIDFRTAGVVEGAGINKLIKAHGSLMVIAWLGLASVGIMLARHYKGVWDDKKLLGQKVWFTCHRGLMLSAIICAIASMSCIFAFYGWKINTVHAYFGVAANLFMIFQPIGALFRCHPGTDNRWIFNWLHWFGGNAGQISALCAIFLATYLPSTGLSMVFLWLVIAFLAMHITVHLIVQVYSRFIANENRVSDSIAMQDIHGNKSAFIEDNGEYFKQLMLGVYVVLVTVVVLALILIIAFAKPR